VGAFLRENGVSGEKLPELVWKSKIFPHLRYPIPLW
jgi:hypothetical protein